MCEDHSRHWTKSNPAVTTRSFCLARRRRVVRVIKSTTISPTVFQKFYNTCKALATHCIVSPHRVIVYWTCSYSLVLGWENHLACNQIMRHRLLDVIFIKSNHIRCKIFLTLRRLSEAIILQTVNRSLIASWISLVLKTSRTGQVDAPN